MPLNITLERAKDIWENRANGGCTGMSNGKGGRTWLDGEFCLDELEALCVVLRAHAGEHAQGAEELVESWRQMEAEDAAIDKLQAEPLGPLFRDFMAAKRFHAICRNDIEGSVETGAMRDADEWVRNSNQALFEALEATGWFEE